MLPKPTGRIDVAYMARLVRELEAQLQRKAGLIEGKVYVTADQPLVIISPDGTQWQVTLDDTGNVVTTAL